jgi:hypothetical protein
VRLTDVSQRPGAIRGASARVGWAVLLCAVVSFGVTLIIAWRLDQAAAFDQNNLIFKDDCATGLMAFSEGWVAYNTFRHPNLHFFIGHPIRLGTALLNKVLPLDVARLRHRMALLVSPAIGALAVLVFGFVLLELHVAPVPTVLLTGLATASFSHLVFSSIPTHFGFSGLMVTALMGLFLKTSSHLAGSRYLLWLLAGFVATGVTSFNLASWALFYGAACIVADGRQRWTRAIVQAAAGAAIVVLVTVLFNTILSVRLYGQSQLFGVSYLEPTRANTALYLRDDAFQRLSQFPEALVTTFVASSLSTSPIVNSPSATYPFVFSLSTPSTWRIGWVVISLLVALVACLGVAGHLRSRSGRMVCLLAVAQMLLCVSVLLVYGDDSLFLYSQHWQSAMLIVFAGAGQLEGLARRLSIAAMAILLIVASARSASVWQGLFEALAASR